MAENHEARFGDDEEQSRYGAKVDHHEKFGEIASGDYMGNARVGQSYAAERSVAATGVDFDHQQVAVHDSAFASGAARFVEDGGVHADFEVFEDGRLSESIQADQARTFDYESGISPSPSVVAPYSGGISPVFGPSGTAIVADVLAPASDSALASRSNGMAPTIEAQARPKGQEQARANKRTREHWAEKQAEKKEGELAAAAAAQEGGLAGGATYVDSWQADVAATQNAFIADVYDATGDATVVEKAGEVFFVDHENDFASELAEEGDGKFDVDKAYAKGKESKYASKGSLADRVKSRAKTALKASALAVVDEGSGDVEASTEDAAAGEMPGKAKAAKKAYSRLHQPNAQKTLSSAQRAARHGLGKNAAVEEARAKVAEVGGKGLLARAKSRLSGMANALKNPATAKAALLGIATVLLFAVFVFFFSMCSAAFSGAGSSNAAEAYTAWAESVAANDKVGYSQPNRTTYATRNERDGWGDVDCSSFVYYALLNNGWTEEELGGSYPFTTFNMCDILEKCDFMRLNWDDAKNSLQRGDIVVDVSSHVSIYAGDGREVAAHGTYGHPEMGDQTGKEVSLSAFYAPGGGFQPDYVMRCTRSGSSGDFSGNTNIEKCWNFFISKGYSKAATAGIIGNFMQESSPSVQPDYNQIGGPGYGIGQWSYADGRRQNLERMAAQWGYEPSSIEAQLLFVDWELNGGDPTTLSLLNSRYGGIAAFKSMTDVSTATQAFCSCFERAGLPMMSNRISYALSVYGQYA